VSEPPGRAAARRAGAKAQTSAKQNQAEPNKSKQKGLDLLGFIRPNRAFSMGCGRKNNKIFSVSPHCAKRLKLLRHAFSSPPVRETGFDSAMD
jgi:hypothetical protein